MKRMLGKIRKRKYISTVLLSVALVFLFVIGGMIYKTQATGGGKAVIADAVTIGERTYTRDNPLNIIELVPDEAVGAWGYLTGMDNGAVKWSDIAGLPDSAAKHDLCNTWLNNYMKSIIEYNNYTIPENKNQAEYAGKNIYYRKFLQEVVLKKKNDVETAQNFRKFFDSREHKGKFARTLFAKAFFCRIL